MGLIIGLDIGTSSVKAGLFDSAGRLMASATAPVVLHIPQPNWAEQEPEAWWRAACLVLHQVANAASGSRIDALGLSGQCPGHVLVDAQQEAIGRAIIWLDQRAQVEASWLSEKISAAQAQQYLGVDSVGDATNPLARLIWLKEHRSQDWENAARVLQPKDYIALKLSGQTATDRYSAYSLAHPYTGEYASELFNHIGIDLEKLPPTRMPTEILGQVTQAASGLTGLAPGTDIIIGTIDAYCDTLAGGIACSGRAVDVAGTSEIVSLRVERPVQANGIYAARLDDKVEFLCGPTQAGGETLRWLARNFFPEFKQAINFSTMESEARMAPAGCEGVIFLPYLNGERTPIWDAHARGAYFGLSFTTQKAHFTRAVYEGVAFAVRHILELGEQARGERSEKIVLCGGGSRSLFWDQVKADVLQREVYPAEIAETGCLGAAILASIGTGMYSDLATASEGMVRLKEPIQPDLTNAAAYDRAYRMYRQLYPVLKPLFRTEADLDLVKGR